MPLSIFQPLCVLVLAVAIVAMARLVPARRLAFEYAALAAAALVGEDSCIRLYGFYHYAPGWALRVDQVPILVPLIWPLVILSARELGRALGLSGYALIAWVLAQVTLDASLVEIIAVRAGYWRWTEPGYLDVPLVGILGWGIFAAAAVGSLERLKLGTVIVAPVLTHVGLLLAWWGCFRWVARAPITGQLGLVVFAALATVAAWRAGRRAGLSPMAPRMIAAGLFLALLVCLPDNRALLVHTAALAVPYLALTRYAS